MPFLSLHSPSQQPAISNPAAPRTASPFHSCCSLHRHSFWRTKEDPDPDGETLECVPPPVNLPSRRLIRPPTRRLIIDALEANWHKFEAKGVRDLGILIDWCSLFQAPRDEDQQRVFGASLKAINQAPTLSPR